MRHLAYVAMLAFCLLGTAWLELVIGVRVWRRWRRLLLTVLPVVVVFVAWDLYAISRHHWSFDPEQTTGVVLPGGLPLDELLFFLVVPTCSVLALEAVRAVRGWPVGDGGADGVRRPVWRLLPGDRRPAPGARSSAPDDGRAAPGDGRAAPGDGRAAPGDRGVRP